MSSVTARSHRTPKPSAALSPMRRTAALARAEVRLFVRNRTAMLTAVALPIGLVAMMNVSGIGEESDLPATTVTMTMMVGFVLLFVVYYNLVSAYVARREELVLKRLRVGELTDREILAGTALPSLGVACIQTVLVMAGVALVIGMEMPVNVLLVLFGFIGGGIVFTLLAAASTPFTRNVEMAQISTMPVLVVCMMLSGMAMPLDVLPDTVADVARFLPLTPVIDLTNLGLAGIAPDGTTVDFAGSFEAAALPVAILVAWTAIGTWGLRRWFRWEPRG